MVMVNKGKFLSEETYRLIKYGFLAIYKRPNFTCAEELECLKDVIIREDMKRGKAVYEEKYLLRAGHGGNLDSMATGVLAVGLCDGCKILSHMLSSSKRYTVTGKLGFATSTYNNGGEVIAKSNYDHVTRPMLEEALKEFVGDIFQKPPAYSALKIKGQRSSDIVKSGGMVHLRPRPVTCHTAHCLKFDPPYFTLDVSCGQGFYVRSLVHDLAEAVGSSGHVTALVRTKHGPFTLKDCLKVENYSLNSIAAASREAHRKYPKLVQKLNDYWTEKETNKLKSQKNDPSSKEKSKDDVDDIEFQDYSVFRDLERETKS